MSSQTPLCRQANTASSRADPWLRLVALFKLIKAALLLATAWGFARMLDPGVALQIESWIKSLRSEWLQYALSQVLERANGLGPLHLQALSVGSTLAAGILVLEGYGLWRGLRWAEYLTVAVTSLLIPVELYEVLTHRRPTVLWVLVLNLGVVWYLLRRLKHAPA